MRTIPILPREFEAVLESAATELEVERMEPGLGHAIGQAWQNLPPSTKEWIKAQLRLAIQDTLRGRPQDVVQRAIVILLPQLFPTALQMAAGAASKEQLQNGIRHLVRSTPIPPAVLERRKGMTREQIRQYERRQRGRGRTPGRNRALGRGRWRESEIDSATTALEFELAVPSSTAGDLEIASAELVNELAAYESGAEQTEQESVGTISSSDYLKWVQRSLNRLYGIRIPTDGKDSNAYRTALRKFNAEYSGRDYSDVDERTQNDLISVNEAPGSYVAWVIRALNQAVQGPWFSSEIYTSAVRNAIKAFQRVVGLRADGFVGSKTELAIIRATGTRPPGEFKGKRKKSVPTSRESCWRMRPPVRYQRDKYICWAAAISSWSIVTKGAKKFATTKSVLDHFRPTGAMNTDDSLILPSGMEQVMRLFGLKFEKFEGGGSLSAVNICPLLEQSHLLVVFKRPGATYHHFVVVYGVDRFHICFMDPELNPAAPDLNRIRKNRVCARIDRFGAGATEFFVFWKEGSGSP